ncbi:unnamed protein product, partial [Rotaria sp. Silwood2]
MTVARAAVVQVDQYASILHPSTIYPDISDCWPDCPSEISGEKLDLYKKAL